MKKIYLLIAGLLLLLSARGQAPLSGPNGYRVIGIGDNGQGDYTQSLILLHEAYNGSLLPFNNTVGTIIANRGNASAYNRTSTAYVNTSSSYNATYGSVQSVTSDAQWKLKTCIYNGKKYLALDVPYLPAYHNWGYQFAGWSNSSGESLKCVNYTVNGQPVNQNVLSDIQDFGANMTETRSVSSMNVLGNVNIGTETTNPDYLFQVKGKIRAQEIKVETTNWADYVFKSDYPRMPLDELKAYVEKNHRLPELPSAKEVEEQGLSLGEANRLLVKKVEELTLYLISEHDKNQQQQAQISKLSKKIEALSSGRNRLAPPNTSK